MDSFDVGNIKAEKANAMLRYRRVRKIANLFRCLEVCVALVILSWFSTRLPVAVEISGQYFRELCEVLVSPRFVFLVGNAIILTLFAKSGQFFAQGPSPNTTATDNLYEEFIKNNIDNHTRQKPRSDDTPLPSSATVPEEFVDTMYEEEGVRTVTTSYLDDHVVPSDSKVIFQRSQSENLKLKLKGEAKEKPHRKLRRSETDMCRKIGSDEEKAADEMGSFSKSYADDNVSDEEFQRIVEAFIAKHQKFQREEESMDIVLQNLYC